MKKYILTCVVLASGLFSMSFAQDKTKPKKDEQIIVRKKSITTTEDGKDEKLTIVVDGDKVTVNGKAVDEYKDGEIEIIRGNGTAFAPKRPSIAGTLLGQGYSTLNNKAFLGVTTEKVDQGAKILEVSAESSAEKAGLKAGDIITKINDQPIVEPKDLSTAIGKYNPEEEVKVTYIRDGKTSLATAKLTKRKAMTYSFSTDDLDYPTFDWDANSGINWSSKPKLGLNVEDLEEGDGVKVKEVNSVSPAAKAGLKEQDIIITVDGAAVKNVDDLKSKLRNTEAGKSYKIEYKRAGKIATTELKYPKKIKSASL